jgi:hypothetical protein
LLLRFDPSELPPSPMPQRLRTRGSDDVAVFESRIAAETLALAERGA